MIRYEPLTINDFYLRDGNALDRMQAPTLDEWTVAIETLKSKEAHADWWQRNGFAAQQTANLYANQMNAYNYGLNQQNAGQQAYAQNALLQQLLGQQEHR